MYVANRDANAITEYSTLDGGALIGTIAGSNTQLNGPMAVAAGSSGTVYVLSNQEILEFPAGQTGNISPSAVIGGPHTGLYWPSGIAVDSAENIYVTNIASNEPDDSIMEFASGSKGDASPVVEIAGPKARLGEGPVARIVPPKQLQQPPPPRP